MAVKIVDYAGSNTAGVDVNHNQLVNLPMLEAQAGYAVLAAERDSGGVTGTRDVSKLTASAYDRLRSGRDTLFFNEVFPSTFLNSGVWGSYLSTMTTTVANGFANLNAGLSTASGAYALLRTYRHFPGLPSFAAVFRARVQITKNPVTNNVCEWGLGIASGTSAPTDGTIFRLNALGDFYAVAISNSIETPVLINSTITPTSTDLYRIETAFDHVTFWRNDQILAKIPVTSAAASASMQLPIYFRCYNTAVTADAQQMKIGTCGLISQDGDLNRPWPLACAGQGGMGMQGQGGGTMGGLALYANSSAPTAAVPTNNTAALGTGLGGVFRSTATIAANTDGIISSFQVPSGTAAVPGKTLVITGVNISTIVQTSLSNGPVLLLWGLALGHTAVSLNTGEGATTKQPRRKALGHQVFANAAQAGTQATTIRVTFASPVVVQPGEFVQTIYRNSGTAATAGAFEHAIDFDCFWE